MLDIGVGTGRTTPFFARMANEYVGIDYSETMIKVCLQRFAGYPESISFEVGDVRHMKSFEGRYFDFVLFSFNGLDYLNHDDRLVALREIRRCTKNGGHFCFSTHDLNYGSKLFQLHTSRNPITVLHRTFRFCLLWVANRNVDKGLQQRQYAILNDGAQNFGLETYYVRANEQVRQLTDSGFTNIRIFGLHDGREMGHFEAERSIDPWLYYLCNVNG
jgi:ubiquinone/menaquinone biosynthesis C-methylase UbiE